MSENLVVLLLIFLFLIVVLFLFLGLVVPVFFVTRLRWRHHELRGSGKSDSSPTGVDGT